MSIEDAHGGGTRVLDPAEPGSGAEGDDAARQASPPVKRAGGRWAPWVLVGLTLLAMGRVVGNDFSGFDDDQTIWRNPRLNPPQFTPEGALWYWSNPHMSLWAPVTYTAWAGLAKATYVESADPNGAHVDPRAFHAGSLLGHVAGVLLVYAILRRLTRRPWAAAAGATVFAVHPLQVEAVAWASGLKDVLAATFSLAALACYLAAVDDRGNPGSDDDAAPATVRPRRPLAWHALGLLCFALALLSKPSAMVLPLIAGAIDYWVVGRPARRVALAVLPYALLAVPVAIVAKIVQSGAGIPTVPLWQRPVLAGGSLGFYLWKLVAPVGLAFDYGWRPPLVTGRPWFSALAAASLVVLVVLALTRRRWPGVFAGAVVFVAALLPVLGFTTFTFQYHSTVGDHYAYLAMLGPALAVAWGLARLRRERARQIAAGACVLAAVVWTALSVRQLGYWRDPVTNLERTIAVARCSALASTNLGQIYAERGDVENAERNFRAAAECNPDFVIPHKNLVSLYAFMGRPEDAIREFRALERANALLPDDQRQTFPHDVFLKAGQGAARGRDFRNAERYFEEAARSNPSDPRGAMALEQVRKILSGAATRPTTAPK
jgi:tetratricopeptide (TPR) repeat protein